MSVKVPKKYNPFKSLKEVVGLLPATDKTPDIYYCDDEASEKVALLTFLTLWFMPPSIQAIVKKRSPSFIAALSPLAGGVRLETIFRKAMKHTAVTSRVDGFMHSLPSENYAGRCYQPLWSYNQRIVIPGLIAVYAASIRQDEARGYTHDIQESCKSKFINAEVPDEDKLYRSISDSPRKGGIKKLGDLFNGCVSHEALNEWLAYILRKEFSDIEVMYDNVPITAMHEVGHLLLRNSYLFPTAAIETEVKQTFKGKFKHSYFKNPYEAVAELTGIALLSHVQENAQLNYGMPSSRLDLVLPDSYQYIERELHNVCQNPSDVEHSLWDNEP